MFHVSLNCRTIKCSLTYITPIKEYIKESLICFMFLSTVEPIVLSPTSKSLIGSLMLLVPIISSFNVVKHGCQLLFQLVLEILGLSMAVNCCCNCNYIVGVSFCIVCGKDVRPRQEALQCDGCHGWQHRICDTKISRDFYRRLVKKQVSLEKWLCSSCTVPNVESFLPSTESTQIDDTFIQDTERSVYSVHPGGSRDDR